VPIKNEIPPVALRLREESLKNLNPGEAEALATISGPNGNPNNIN